MTEKSIIGGVRIRGGSAHLHRHRGYPPGTAAAMPDYGDEEWREMVCLEAADALESAVTLNPGAEHTMSAQYAVDHLI
ncbi:MAG: hypothetical protein ACJ72M_06665 [Propionibacteriaceae bacterium]